MPLRQMPNGEYVDLPDDVTPEGLAKIEARYPASASSGGVTVSVQPQTEDDKQIEAMKERRRTAGEGAASAVQDNLTHNMTLGLDDVMGGVLEAGTEGVGRAFKKRDVREIGRTYKNSREASAQYRDDQRAEHPLASVGGQVTGILANPVGASTGAAALMSKVAPGALKVIKASKIGQTVGKLGSTMPGIAARSGFNQGFITGAVDDGNLEDAANEGLIGGVTGGVAGGALRVAKGIGRTIADHAPENAKRVAYDKITALLNRSENPATRKAWTPDEIAAELRATDAGGGDGMVADVLPEGQGWLSHLAKQPGSSAANRLVNRARERADDAPNRFDARVRQIFDGPTDAYDKSKTLRAEQKAAGARDYSDDVMERQLAWSSRLDNIAKNEAIQDVLPMARKNMRIDGKDENQLIFTNPEDPGKGMMGKAPSMGTLKYVTESLDSTIQAAMKAGDRNTARRLSRVNREMKDAIAEVNPELRDADALQRDYFQRQEGLELGSNLIGMLKSGKSREALDLLSTAKPEEARLAFADSLLKLREKPGGDNPVALMRKFMRSPEQRKVLEQMMGDTRTLNEFERFMRREIRSTDTDDLVGSGRSMQRDYLKERDDGGAGNAATDVLKGVGQGFAFGGPIGAASRGARSLSNWRSRISDKAKEEVSQILSGKGEDIKKGVTRSAAYKRIIARRDARAGKLAGKAPATVVGGYSEQ